MMRVNAILDDVKDVTAKVKEETERVDHAIHTTIDRIDDTAGRVRTNVRAKPVRSPRSCAWRPPGGPGMLHRSGSFALNLEDDNGRRLRDRFRQ